MTDRSPVALPRRRTARSERLGALVVGLAAEGAPAPEVPADDLDEVVALAVHHRLPGLAFQRLRSAVAGADAAGLAPLSDAYRAASTHNLAQLAQLAQLGPVLDDADPSWLVVKGPVLAGEAYGDPGLRTAYDLDLVVSPERFPDVLAALEAAGGRPRQRNWPLLARLELGQLVVDLPLGGTGDLHWHLVNTPFARRRFALDMDELRERRRIVTLDGVRVPTLDPNDTVLHLCLHGALSGGHLLVWTKDVARATTALPVDWDELVRRARRARLGLVAALQLERARVVLGAPVDPAVISALAPRSALVAAWSRADRTWRSPWARDHRTGKTVSTALSATTPATVVELVRRLPSEVVGPRLSLLARRPASLPPGQSLLTRPAGGEAAREHYLAFVVAQGATRSLSSVRR
ncbi:MAG: nucleotidyltransferase family protein [Actinomycetota bacterium]|jgi:hypothetical protein|nr:nucleotidyltransferase family protein [Actinomycetota bacterium]